MADWFERALDPNAQVVPNYQLPKIGFYESLGIGADEAKSSLSYNLISDVMLPKSTSQELDEEQWRKSPFYRDGLRYEPGMNWDWAQSMAEAHDRAIQFSELHDRMTFSGEVGSFVGGMGAGMLDPINFIALPAGIGVGAGRAVGSKILSGALHGAMTNAAIETALSPLRKEQADLFQTRYGLPEFALDVGVSGALGGVIGGVGGAIGALRTRRRVQTTEEAQTPTSGDPGQPAGTPVQPQEATVPKGMMTLDELQARHGDSSTNDIMNQIRQKHLAAPEHKDWIDEQTRQASPAEIAKSLLAEMKGKSVDDSANVLADAARTLPKDMFASVLELKRNAAGANLIAWKNINQLFNTLVGSELQITRHLSARTIADAIWERVNNNKAVDPYSLFQTQEPSNSVQILKNASEADPNVSPDRYVVIDEIDGEISGSTLSIARSADRILDKMKTRGGNVIVNMSDGLNSSRVEVPTHELKQYLNDLREETGIANMEKVLDGAEPIIQATVNKTREQHFSTIKKAWSEMRKLYGSQDRAGIARQADEMLAAMRSPEDMSEIVQGLREFAGESAELNALLDLADNQSKDLAARREALKQASLCIIGGKA